MASIGHRRPGNVSVDGNRISANLKVDPDLRMATKVKGSDTLPCLL